MATGTSRAAQPELVEPAPGPFAEPLPDRPLRSWRLAPLAGVVVAVALIVVSHKVGVDLLEAGKPIVLPWPPLLAFWHPHVGWGTPLVVLCLVVGLLLQRRVAVVRWSRLLLAGWLLNLAWMVSLVMIDGFDKGWVRVLLDPNEYLHDLFKITDPLTFFRTFTDYIAFSPTLQGYDVWTTHVAGHPPLITFIFWTLQQIGLGGGFWAGLLCILVGSAVAVGLPVTLRELGAPDAARRMVPFAALLPGSVWIAVSADGLFAGVAVGGLALAVRGAARRKLGSSLVGGLLLGASLYLSYGLVLFGIVVLVGLVITARQHGLRTVLVPWALSVVGVAVVAAGFFALGFNWFAALVQLRIRYYQQTASDRPFSYFVWSNFAAWVIAWTPVLAYGIVRSVGVLVLNRRGPSSQDRVVALVALGGTLAAVLADLSALSKAETERIWLSFGAAAYVGLALLRGRWAMLALILCAGWAVGVNSLLDTGW